MEVRAFMRQGPRSPEHDFDGRLVACDGLLRDDHCSLSHQSMRDLNNWCELRSARWEGHEMSPPPLGVTLHTDTADVGYGGC